MNYVLIQNILIGFIIINQIMGNSSSEYKPVKMVIFNGPLSFNPNTLNNNILTFALAKKWQEQQRTYEDWIKLIENLVQIGRSLSVWAKKNYPQNKDLISSARDMALFNTWNVEGDGSVYVDLQAKAIFDSELESPFKILQQHERFPVSSPPGHHKAVIADMDTDSQMMSKLFAFQLIMNNNLSFAWKPTSFVNITLKYLNKGGDQNMGADWWTKGSLKILSDKTNKYSEDVLNYFVKASENSKYKGVQLNNNFQIRMNQSNYNQTTKLSYINGYILQSQIDDGLSISHWRRVLARKNEIGGKDYFYMKSIKKVFGKNGVLLDLNSAIKAYVDEKTSKMAFDSIQVKISQCFAEDQDGKQLKIDITLTPQQSFKHCGFYYVEGYTLIDRPAQSEIIVTVPGKQPVSFGKNNEQQYSFQIEERYKKTEFLYKEDPNKYDIEAFEPFIEYRFRCTRFGKPIPSNKIPHLQVRLKIDLSPLGGIDSTGMTYAQPDTVIKILQDALQDPTFKSEYESLDVIKTKWYLGSLPMITETATNIQSRINSDGNWINSSKKPFAPQFYQANENIDTQSLHIQSVKLDENGYGTFRVFLNENITRATNPRSLSNTTGNSIISCLCIQSLITPTIIDNSLKQEKVYELYGDTTSGIYFQSNPENGKRSADWKNYVGPRLRMMGLLYPAMQRIIDLYSFNEIHLGSMKRAFDIQSQLNSRYMPSTRQISSFEHRMIRRWLYEPYYDHFNVGKPVDYNKIFKRLYPEKQIKSDFATKKAVLRQLLKNGFAFELLTIPLYLNAMYGAPSNTIQKLIRGISHDEMKHLFIASNLINSIREQGCEAEENGPPYLDPKYVPHFPQKPLYAYESKDKYIDNLYTFDILPYGQDLLMKFIAAEFPGETQNLILSTQITLEGKQLSKEEENNIDKAKSKIEEITKMIAKVNQQKSKNEHFVTVGQMYGQVIELLWQLSDQQDPQRGHILFSGNPIYQFTYPQLENMTEIYSLRTALNQIRLIVQEGEGSRIFSVDNKLKKLSHFLKFIQAYVGYQVDEEKTNNLNDPYGKGYFKIYFKYNPNWIINDAPKNSWTPEQNKQLREIIKDEKSGLTPGGYEKYSNNISPNAFTNMYQKILMEFHYIFNSSFSRYKDFLNNDKNLRLTSGQYLSYFKNFKFKRMENAIAKMRNMSLLARYNVRLENTPNFESVPSQAKGNQGKSVQPGFNVRVNFPED